MAKTMHQTEAALRATLTDLAERWRGMRSADPNRVHTYKLAARDLDDVLRTGLIPHDLMTDAELEQHGARQTGDGS